MIPNAIKALWAAGRPAINGWLSVGNSFTAEIMASAGYDSITADLQHGAFDYHATLTMFQAMRASGVTIMARVPWLDAGAIMKVLDAGAYGVICPMINSREEAERLVSYVRYPPHGTRSFGPTRVNFAAGANYGGEANDNVVCLAMIETREAFERVEEIASTPGLDGLYIGPADLTLGLTGTKYRTGFDREEREMVDAIRRILDVAHRAGKRACLHNGTAAYAAKAIGWGFDLVTVSNDVRLLAGAAEASVAEVRKLHGQAAWPDRRVLTMPNVLVAGRIHQAGLDVLRSVPEITLDFVDEVSLASYAPRLPEADALLIRTQPLPGSVIATAPRLRIVSRHGVGYDSVDVAALTARQIPLAVVGDVNSRAVAEHTLALILALAKRVTAHDAATRDGRWSLRNAFSAREIGGRSLLLIGYGRIGRMVGDMARAFGMRILAFDPYQTPDAIRAANAEPVGTLAEGLAAADVVSLHLPKSGDRALIGRDEIPLMRPGALLVNTARGGLIDEDALADALDAGHVGGAGLDVFVAEPPVGNERLLKSDRTILSPHVAGLTEECTIRMGEVAARNIVDFFAGRLDPSLVVNGSAH